MLLTHIWLSYVFAFIIYITCLDQHQMMTMMLVFGQKDENQFRGALIISNPAGFNDMNDIVGSSEILTMLQYSINDFTVAAPETTRSYSGFLTGLMQLDNSVDNQNTTSLNAKNMLSIFKAANIPTFHAGLWPFDSAPNATDYFISGNPRETIDKAISFVKNRKGSYLLIVFLPYVDVTFLPLAKPLASYPGTEQGSIYCSDEQRVIGKPPFYKYCNRQIYVASRNYEDSIVGDLLSVLTRQKTTVFWSPVHGGLNPHIHATSVPRSNLRGEHRSLYDGGIRTKFRYSPGIYSKLTSKDGNAIDILPTFISLAKISYSTKEFDGKDLTKASSRSMPLMWTASAIQVEGDCINASPGQGIQLEYNGMKYKVLYDAERTEVYEWNSGYEYAYADVKADFNLTRPNYTIKGCSKLNINSYTFNNSNPSPVKGVINIIADDMGYGDISYTSGRAGVGRNYHETPNIDRLIQSGLFFDNYYAGSCVCSPTRASILTGRYPFHDDVRINDYYSISQGHNAGTGLPQYLGKGKNITYIPSFFKSQGWATAHFGKWHLSYANSPTLSRYGYDDFKCYSCSAPPKKSYWNGAVTFSANASQYITTDTIDWIRDKVANNQNFYVTVAYQNAHAPMNVLPGQPEEHGFPSSLNPYAAAGVVRTDEKYRAHQILATLIKEQDKQIGRLYDELVKLGIEQDVILVWSSDNGPEQRDIYFNSVGSPGPHRGGKRSLFEGGTHVPFFIKWGDRLSGITNMLASSADLYPTLASMAGLDITKAFDYKRLDGIDLSPCILSNNCEQVNQRSLIFERRGIMTGVDCSGISPRFAIRKGNYKLLLDSPDKTLPSKMKFTRKELYDVLNDPLESQNIYDDHPEIVNELQNILFSYNYYNTLFPRNIPTHYENYKNKDFYVGFACVVLYGPDE